MAGMMKQVAVVFLVAVVMGQSWLGQAQGQAQSCSAQLSNLNGCAPFVLPGAASNPSPECCGALQGVQQDCLCSTIRIASTLPSLCHLPPLSCG